MEVALVLVFSKIEYQGKLLQNPKLTSESL